MMKDFVQFKWIILILILIHKSSLKTLSSQGKTLFGSTQVIRCLPQSHSQLLFLNSLKSNLHYDFWLNPREVEMPVDIMASGIHLLELKSTLQNYNIQCIIFMEDVPSTLKMTLDANTKALTTNKYFLAYHTYEEIVDWMKKLEKNYPHEVTLIKVGRSYEVREMYVAKLSRTTGSTLFKPALWVDGGMHGREWISPAVVTYMLHELLTNSTYGDLLQYLDFYFMPVMNPDGYDYTFQDEKRLWRKSRSWKMDNGFCRGADVNRNWNFHWNGTGGDPCAENYPGNFPFSEKEIAHAKTEMMNNILQLKGYLSYHSYAQLWLFPWGYTTELVDDFFELETLSSEAVEAIYTYSGTRYKQQPYCVEPELCINGDSIDYAKGVNKIKYSFLIQLPDLGNYGFLLPPSEIIPTGEESLRGLLVIANAILNG